MRPYYDDGQIAIFHGDVREVLSQLDPGVADIVIADPPYSSGGFTRGDRNGTTGTKYQRSDVSKPLPDFAGDSRDQRSMAVWCSYWMADAIRVCRAGSALACFIDWRNLPVVVDAVQVAGWVYRGILVWDKTEQAKPEKGWFRTQAEYLVLASAGPIGRGPDVSGICSPGVFRRKVDIQEKQHQSEKPVQLLREILITRDDWQTVLDPFMGSGTTLRAAKDLGRKAIGIDIDEHWCECAANRLSQGVLPFPAQEPTP